MKKQKVKTKVCRYSIPFRVSPSDEIGDYVDYEGYEETCWDVEFLDRAYRTEYTHDYDFNISVGHLESEKFIDIGNQAIIVWANYSSGSTFGMDYNKYTQVIDIFDINEMKIAQELANKCKALEGFGNKKILIEDREFKIYPQWLGYFDRLTAIRIDTAIVV